MGGYSPQILFQVLYVLSAYYFPLWLALGIVRVCLNWAESHCNEVQGRKAQEGVGTPREVIKWEMEGALLASPHP